jgi:hypothetical protein
VAFYPLAGRLDVSEDGRTQITFDSEGALFVIARSQLTAGELDLGRHGDAIHGAEEKICSSY